MISPSTAVFASAVVVAVIVLDFILSRVSGLLKKHVPYAERTIAVLNWPIERLIHLQFHIARLALPDSVFKLWYRTAMLDEETYRHFQDRGYIKDTTDPKYLQRTHND